jgi:Arc/MetJ family transcription regulator
MKVSLTVDDKLMAQAMVALDSATHADAINLALQHVVTKHAYQQVLALRGTLKRADDFAEKTRSLDDLVGVLAPAKALLTTEALCAPIGKKKANG